MYSIRTHTRGATVIVLAIGIGAACAPMDPVPAPMGVQPGPEFATDAMWADAEAIFAGTLEGARFAVGHTQDAALRTYAQRLVDDYTAAQQTLSPIMQRHGITARPGPQTEALTRGYRETGEALRAFEGRDFDQRYIDHQIAMNRWLLDAIDRSYLPAAQRHPDLQRELTTLRATIQGHLQEAERLRTTWR
jgi:predicted outer membrane protein